MKTSSWKEYRDNDGAVRISVGAPRFVKGSGKLPYFSELAPLRAWLKLERADYEEKFKKKLAQLNAQELYDRIVEKVAPHEPVLLCFEQPPFNDNNWCHRRMVAEWFEAELNVKVSEIGFEEE